MQQGAKLRQTRRTQRHSLAWFSARRYRITASVFGIIYHRKPDMPLDALWLPISLSMQR